ncbi:HNH endonuclease [Chloroflexi bacterium CFX3]|nr:HNH endonuclease [Chloroflexi bacterium CFX3]
MDAFEAFLKGEADLFDWHLAYQQTNAFRSELYAYWQRYRARMQRDPEERAAYAREWKRRNKDRVRAIEQRYLKRRATLPNTFTDKHWQHALKYFNNRCAVCGSADQIHQAHWIPLSRPECPGTLPSNIIPLCRSCNISQRAKLPTVWLRQTFDAATQREIIRKVNKYFASLNLSGLRNSPHGVTGAT